MAISDRITSIEEHIKESYQELEGIGIDTTRVNKNLENIPKLIDGYWETLPKVTGEGTSITLDNTKEGKMKIDLKGNTYQDSTTGKNKLPYTNDINETINSTKITGVKGTYTIQTTPTATVYQTYVNLVENYTIQSGDYLHIMNDVANANITFNLKCTDDTILSPTLNSLNRIFDLSSYVGKSISSIRFYVSTSYDGAKITLTPMIVNSGTATEWEQFTFGASPNPDYPQDIHVVSGDNTIKVEGKNLFDESNLTLATVQEDGKECYKIAGTTASPSNVIWNEELKENTQYTISMVAKRVQYFNHIVFYYKDGTNNYVNFTNTTFQRINATSQANKTLTKIQIDTGDFPAFNYIEVGTIQLEEGTSATPYEEHKEQTYPINLGSMELCKIGDYQDYIAKSTGKNLFDVTTWVTKGNNGTYYSYSNGVLSINALDGRSYNDFVESERIYLANGNYYLSNIGSATIRVYTNSSTIISTNQFEVTQGYVYIKLVSSSVMTCRPMIEKGSTATTYEPYGKVWYKYGAIGKVVLNGSENWTDWNLTGEHPKNITGYLLDNYVSYNNSSGGDIRGVCNNFKVYSNGWVYAQSLGLRQVGDTLRRFYVAIDKNITPTLEDYKTWLSTHNTEVYYVLATPTDTEITDTTLLSQLEALNGARSYTGQTNISQESNDLASLLNATALEEME